MSINHEAMVVYGCLSSNYLGKDVFFHEDVDLYEGILGFEVCFDGGCTLMELVDTATLYQGLFRNGGYSGELRSFLVEVVY
jgi:hypothetical protein